MDVSNKTLGMLLVAAIVVSVGGTFLSLQQLGSLSGSTGFATSDSGQVNLTVAQTLSIELTDDVINFGECLLNDTNTIFVDSSVVRGSVDNAYCDNTAGFPDDLALRNAGNVHACVNMQTNANGTTLFGTDGDSGIGYKVYNHVSEGGCAGTLQATYRNFTSIGASDYPVCTNLTAIANQDKLNISIGAWLNPNAKVGGLMTLTINAADSAVGCP